MSQDLNRELARLARGIRSHRLARDDLAVLTVELRRALASAHVATDLRRAIASLHRTIAELHRIARTTPDAAIDTRTLEDIPQRVRTRLDRRLSRLPIMLSAASSPARDLAFRCIDDLERCRARASGSGIWCHIAAAVCLLRALLPVLLKRPAP